MIGRLQHFERWRWDWSIPTRAQHWIWQQRMICMARGVLPSMVVKHSALCIFIAVVAEQCRDMCIPSLTVVEDESPPTSDITIIWFCYHDILLPLPQLSLHRQLKAEMCHKLDVSVVFGLDLLVAVSSTLWTYRRNLAVKQLY